MNTGRKRADDLDTKRSNKKSAKVLLDHDDGSKILLLESKILESRRNYNDITELVGYLQGDDDEVQVLAAIALCRVFCRLLAAGALTVTNEPSEGPSESNRTISQWLLERLKETYKHLFGILKEEDPAKQTTVLTIMMQLLKEQAKHYHRSNHEGWSRSGFHTLIETLIAEDTPITAAEGFGEMFAARYDDIRYYTFSRLTYVAVCLQDSGSVFANGL